MKKIFRGRVVSLKMQNTAVVEVLRYITHPLYKKRLKRTKKYKADYTGQTLALGDKVSIVEVRPISKDKNFKVLEKLK
jgi:small subunit ribosomal protein S17